MINGVVAAKLQNLDRVLVELRSLGELSPARLEQDWIVRRAVERDLQLLVEVVIDVCQRLLSVAGQTPATSAADAIARCVEIGVLRSPAPYQEMVRFRNFIVHRYEYIDAAIVAKVVNEELRGFEQFRDEVLAYVQQD